MHLSLFNAAWAAVLALAAALGTRWLRRYPAVVHTLWLLVLIKLATPSLVQLPISWDNVQPQAIVANREPMGSSDPVRQPRTLAPSREVSTSPRELAGGTNAVSGNDEKVVIRSEPTVTTARPWPWRQIVVALWLFGMTAWWVVIGLSSYRFHRLLRSSRSAPDEVCERLARVLARLGLRRLPTVSMVSARIPPMIWAGLARAPRLVLPEELWSRFDPVQQDAVIAHELAHLKRRDHWVRRLEAVVLGLYWWNPVTWWARRQLERAEEACCDAWVVWALPTAAGAYVEALVTTAVYLSGLRFPLPLGASGAGRVLPLTRRLNMILSDRSTSSLARNVPRAVLVLGVLALPFLPSLAASRTPGGSHSAAAIAELTDEPKQNTPSAAEKPEAKSAATTKLPATDAPKNSRQVRVCQPMVREVSDWMKVLGVLRAVDQVVLKCRVSGYVIDVNCRPGQRVKQGQLLFVIDPRPYQAEVEKAAAEVRLAQSRMKGVRTKLANAQGLVQQGRTGRGPVTEIEAEIEATEAAVQTAKADLELARLKLESTRVTSPIVGKIRGPVLAAGNVAVADTTNLATILSFDPMYVEFDVRQSTMMGLNRLIRDGKIKLDEKSSAYSVLVNLNDGDGFTHPAKVDFEDVEVLPSGNDAKWRAVLPNPDGFLMPGLSVLVKLITGAPRLAHVLPMEAQVFLASSNRKVRAFVVNSENVVESRDVQLAGLYDHDLYVFDAGLKADDWVVIDDFDPTLLGKKVEPVKVSFPSKLTDDKLAPLLTPADRARLRVPFPSKTAEDKPAKP
jgi:RND family efflux transporter MFP subunit